MMARGPVSVPSSAISSPVVFEFLAPVVQVALRSRGFLAAWVSVPEASVDEDAELVLRKDQVRRSRKIFTVESEAVAECVSATQDAASNFTTVCNQ